LINSNEQFKNEIHNDIANLETNTNNKLNDFKSYVDEQNTLQDVKNTSAISSLRTDISTLDD